MQWNQTFTNGAGLSARSYAISTPGVMRTYANVMVAWDGWASGSLESRADASSVELVWDGREPWPFEQDSVMMGFSYYTTGTAFASSEDGGGAGAGVGFTLAIGTASQSGRREVSSSSGSTQEGEWDYPGVRVKISRGEDVYISLSSYAYAAAGKTYLAFPAMEATGDFSQTLRWLGVQYIEGVNPDGSTTRLTGAYIPLIGRDSGFNYFYAAPDGAGDVPEPGTVGLTVAGLALVWWKRRRAATLAE